MTKTRSANRGCLLVGHQCTNSTRRLRSPGEGRDANGRAKVGKEILPQHWREKISRIKERESNLEPM